VTEPELATLRFVRWARSADHLALAPRVPQPQPPRRVPGSAVAGELTGGWRWLDLEHPAFASRAALRNLEAIAGIGVYCFDLKSRQ